MVQDLKQVHSYPYFRNAWKYYSNITPDYTDFKYHGWLREQGAIVEGVIYSNDGEEIEITVPDIGMVSFETEEQAMIFKLRWS